MEEKLYSKKDLVAILKEQLATRDNQAIKGLMTIYSYQTADEQNDGYTEEFNGVGFTGTDSEFLSSLAEKYNQYHSFSEKQLNCLKKIMPKYANQLINHSISSGKIIKEGRKYKFAK